MKPGRFSLLIVDDDPVFSRFAAQLVKSLGDELPCRLACVDSAERALKDLSHSHYDLALLDYNLPGASGLDLLAEIQSLPASLQPAVIMLTASGNESVAVKAMKRGARDYLQKADLDVPSLTRAIKSALAQKRLAEQVAAYNAQMSADLEMARRLQQALLPQRYPTFPRSAHPDESALRFCHRYFWTTQLGGDFFGVQDLSDTQAGVFICDVMGHGVRSALITAMLRAFVADLAPVAGDPSRFLGELNQHLTSVLQRLDETLFATGFYLIADVGAGQLRYACAGHPLPLHVQRTAGNVSPLQLPASSGPALGLFADANYRSCECPLAAEDLILLFTDGLFEVTDPDGTEFGEERLREVVRKRMALPIEALVDKVVADIRHFADDGDFNDDVCLLAMEVAKLLRT